MRVFFDADRSPPPKMGRQFAADYQTPFAAPVRGTEGHAIAGSVKVARKSAMRQSGDTDVPHDVC